ncbi:TetR/AcrR family transcriptional regulator [Aeromicrobium sp. 179-A 4D2 NHS]|uniref:TetR/AcrR family transcriptional regulator n=1 Tax=Aeromicrobium sp. 179-A 4D2 NHS TaxID=3142375 RepID=UPI0039A0F6A7
MRDDGFLSLLPQRLDLPRGRSALPESEVAESRRGRILQATLDEVAGSGYAATTVASITKRAHVSRTSFYEAFKDKEQAFAAAHWNASELALGRVWRPALTGADVDFDTRMRTAVAAYVGVLERARAFTICFYVEIRAAGERLQCQRDEITDQHLAILRDLAEASGVGRSGSALDRDVLRGVLGAFDELVGRAVRAQRHDEELDLGSVVEPFTRLLLAVMHGT